MSPGFALPSKIGPSPVSVPAVSVVLPTRDRRQRLQIALRSALGQRQVELEVIVVDDGSTDGTDELVAAVDDPRLRLIRNQSSEGVSAARNKGVANARGEWLAFLDDDDLWAPDKLRHQLVALEATGRGWAYGGDVIMDPQHRVLGGSPPPPPEEVVAALERYDAVPGGSSSVVASAELLEHVGPFDPGLATSEDWDMWIRMGRAGLPACVSRPVVAISVYGGRSPMMPGMLRDLRVIEQRHGAPVDWPRHYRWAAWEALRDHRRRRAIRYYAAAIRRGDVSSIARAAVALVSPGYPDRHLRSVSPSDWVAQASAWIADLLEPDELGPLRG